MSFELQKGFGLTIRDDSVSTAADAVWEKVALVAGHTELGLPSPEQLARLFNERANPTLSAADMFRQLAEVAESAAGPDAGQNPARLSVVVQTLNPGTLSMAIAAEPDVASRRRFLHQATDVISPAAVSILASAAASAYKRAFSLVLAVLLDKLSRETQELDGELRGVAERAYRDLLKHMFEAWSAAAVDTGATGYHDFYARQFADDSADFASAMKPETYRVLEMVLESGSMGLVAWSALSRVVAQSDGERRMVDMLKQAPADSASARVIGRQFAKPVLLESLLREDPVDFGAVDTLLGYMPAEWSGPVLVEALAEAKQRGTRRNLLDRLVGMGADIRPLVIERLNSDQRWYVQRNMLTVLREGKSTLDHSTLRSFATHADARVRREVTQLLLQDPVEHDRALSVALRDPDVELLKAGLRAAREHLPEAVAPVLAKRVVDPEFPPEFLAAALRILAASTSVLALEALLRFAMSGTSLLGRPKLAAKSPEMLAALSGLARTWPHERRATSLLLNAKESKDPEIARAVTFAPGTALADATAQPAERDVLDDE